jgi:tetratricopeptide (TPR) repeat protein
MERAWSELRDDRPDADVATLAAQIARVNIFKGDLNAASARLESALELAESLWLPDVLAETLNSMGVVASFRSHTAHAEALVKAALELALEHELPAAALRAYLNLGDKFHRGDRCREAAIQLEQGIAYARRVGDRYWEVALLSELSWSLALTGHWTEAFSLLEQVPEERLVELPPTLVVALPEPLVAQGRVDEARHLLSLFARQKDSADFQHRTCYVAAEVVVLRAEGKEREALAGAGQLLEEVLEIRPTDQPVKLALPQALEAALALGEVERAAQLLETVEALPPGRAAPSLRAHAARFRARLALHDGAALEADQGFATAVSIFRECAMPYWLAITLTEHAEALIGAARWAEAEPLLAEARATFEHLDARAWLARVEAGEAEPRAEARV